MLGQLLALERATSRLGKDSISHPPNGHDDIVNAAAGALVMAATRRTMFQAEGDEARGARSEGRGTCKTCYQEFGPDDLVGGVHKACGHRADPSRGRGWSDAQLRAHGRVME